MIFALCVLVMFGASIIHVLYVEYIFIRSVSFLSILCGILYTHDFLSVYLYDIISYLIFFRFVVFYTMSDVEDEGVLRKKYRSSNRNILLHNIF